MAGELLLEAQSGFPITIMDSSGYFPDRICDGSLPKDKGTPPQWFDYNCFIRRVGKEIIDPVSGTKRIVNLQGNSGRYIVMLPGRASGKLIWVYRSSCVRKKSMVYKFAESFSMHSTTSNPARPLIMYNSEGGSRIYGASVPSRQVQVALRILF